MEEIIELRKRLFSLEYSKWTENMLFTFKWWILLIMVVVCWYIWWKIVDKTRLMEIGLVGFTAGLVSTLLNTTGIELTLWQYPNQLFGAVRGMNILDLTLIPIGYMLIYQFFSKWKFYIITVTIFAFLGSFVGQPLFKALNLYEPINWKYVYSIPVYLFIGIIVKLIASKIKTIQDKNN
ncbi:CBO0543 family protein [Sutcliffiella halmapala]